VSGNACYPSVQNILSSGPKSKNLKTKIYRIVISSVVLYGCDTWSLTTWENAFENRVLRRKFEHKRDDSTAERRKAHNEKINDLY
jgi:hypothetical protein